MADLYKLIVSVESLVIAIIVFKRYPSTNCLMQGSCYTPETKFGGVYRSHPVVGRSGGRSVQRSVAFSFSNTTSYNDQAHGEKVQCTRKITPS